MRSSKSGEGANVVDIILCAQSTLSEKELQDIVIEALQEGIKIIPQAEIVSRWPAYNTRQLYEFRTLWPVSLRKDSSRY